MKHVVFLVRSAPYGTAAIAESVRACLGFGAMPMAVSYVLMDDGVWALAPHQNAQAIGAKPVLEILSGLADLDVGLYAEQESLAERGLTVDGLEPAFTPISGSAIADLIARADAVLTY